MPLNQAESEKSSETIISIVDCIKREKITDVLDAMIGLVWAFVNNENGFIEIEKLKSEWAVLCNTIPENDLIVLIEWIGFKKAGDILENVKDLSVIKENLDIFYKFSTTKRDAFTEDLKDGITIDDDILEKILTKEVLDQSLFAEGTVKLFNNRLCLQTADGKRFFHDELFQEYPVGSYLRLFKLEKHFMVQQLHD